jgi:hypothetical protein
MFEVPWQKTGSGYYCQHNQWMMKKKTTAGVTVYMIYENEELKFSNNRELLFNRHAYRILNDMTMLAWNTK